MIGCTFSSLKFAGRAPEDSLLLRAFVSGPDGPEGIERPDVELEGLVLGHLERLLVIRSRPRVSWVRRCGRAMPQYPVGHLSRVARIEREVAQLPGLFLAGNGYRGIGIPDCIHQAEQVAERIFHAN